MKICVFGADGRTGVEVVNYAVEQSFDVVAFVYTNNSNIYFPKNVSIKQGNVMNYGNVEEALKATDAVISVLGHIKNSDPLMQTKGITNIVQAMKNLGIQRVLSLTGTGARTEGDTPSLIDMFLNFVVTRVDPDRMHDGVEHVKVLQNSRLDFTVVRVLTLSKSDKECKNYKLTDGGPAELHTSRKKVAHVLVDLINNKTYIGKLPIISG